MIIRRGGAIIFDRLVMVVAGVFLSPLFKAFFTSNEAFVSIYLSIWTTSLIMPVFYFTLLEGRYGKTLGKQILGLKVVNSEGNRISYQKSAVRNLIRIIDAFPGFYLIGLIATLVFDGKRLGDIAGGTQVVDQRH